MASTTQDDGFHEIQLNGKQLVFLFMAATVVTVVIFLCGVLVGRGIRLDRGGPETALVDPVAAPEDDPPITVGAGSTTPGAIDGDVTYPGRLEGGSAVAEKLTPAEPEVRSESVPDTPPTAVAEPPSTPAAAPPPARAPEPAPAAVAASTPPAGSGVEIQVSAFRERRDADRLANRLVSRGYKAYVVAPSTDAPVLYRVRVGKFEESREATRVAARLKKEEKLDPWIVR